MQNTAKTFKITLMIVLLAASVILMFQNTDVVQTRVFFWSFSVAQAVLIAGVFVVGVVVGVILPSAWRRRKKKT